MYHIPKLHRTNGGGEKQRFGDDSLPRNLQIRGSLFLRVGKRIYSNLDDGFFYRCVETWKLKKNHIN